MDSSVDCIGHQRAPRPLGSHSRYVRLRPSSLNLKKKNFFSLFLLQQHQHQQQDIFLACAYANRRSTAKNNTWNREAHATSLLSPLSSLSPLKRTIQLKSAASNATRRAQRSEKRRRKRKTIYSVSASILHAIHSAGRIIYR